MAASFGFAIVAAPTSHSDISKIPLIHHLKSSSAAPITKKSSPSLLSLRRGRFSVLSCLPPRPSSSSFRPKTRLYVSGCCLGILGECLIIVTSLEKSHSGFDTWPCSKSSISMRIQLTFNNTANYILPWSIMIILLYFLLVLSAGLSFRTTEESLRNAFQSFGQLVEVNLVMDKIANRPRGFAFLRYRTEEESQKAIEGMHGKFLDGRVIFVEIAKPRSELRQALKQNPRQY
ncbi:hypothetical protein Patl1_19507 [Pistacia atlantica]|uniref:Uncharacterized protein n=1 Tax=Pistacia atlantica TaxID=434234 RepID=A0ACC1C224_9ROSI|nr:hypothetical protein Patl1_19507 [Pistacia atlantica]